MPVSEPEFERCMRRVLAEKAAEDAWDSDFNPSPYSAQEAARELARPEWVALLAEALDAPERAPWALLALEQLGPAASAAAPALERAGQGAVLFAVDPQRALAIGADRDPRWRGPILQAILRRPRLGGSHERAHPEAPPESNVSAGSQDVAGAMAHVSRLLDAPDAATLTFALGAGRYPDEGCVLRAAERQPELLPHAKVLRLVQHPERAVRDAAVSLLRVGHAPEHAGVVVEAVASGQALVTGTFAEWLGSHPASLGLCGRLRDVKEHFELARRRRCAGLDTPPEALRAVFLRALQGRSRPRARGATATKAPPAPGAPVRPQDLGYAALGALELQDVDLLPAIVRALGPVPGVRRDLGDGAFEPLVQALRGFGDAGRGAVDAALVGASDRQARVLARAREALSRPQRDVRLADAAARFVAGNVEDGLMVDDAAFGAWARVLLANPRCAVAAFELAWIDRAYGSPITAERLTWLRSLGTAPALLEDLAIPPPLTDVLPGWRESNHRVAWDRPDLAARAERVGLHGLAANWWRASDPGRAELARTAAQEHVERVLRTCPSAGAE